MSPADWHLEAYKDYCKRTFKRAMETVKPQTDTRIRDYDKEANHMLQDRFQELVKRPIMDILRNVFPFAADVRDADRLAGVHRNSALYAMKETMDKLYDEFYAHLHPRVLTHLQQKDPVFNFASKEEVQFLRHAHQWHWPLDRENEQFKSLAWVYGATFGRDLSHELTLFATSVFTEEEEGGNNV